MATARRLSAPTAPAFQCSHRCCLIPGDESHQHLFEPDECPVCHGLERQAKARGLK